VLTDSFRAISAPQIGVNKRFISCNLGKGAFTIINPEITWKSKEQMTLWDGNIGKM
jgi:peptide deformylase